MKVVSVYENEGQVLIGVVVDEDTTTDALGTPLLHALQQWHSTQVKVSG